MYEEQLLHGWLDLGLSKMKNAELFLNKYIIVRKFIDVDWANELSREFDEYIEENPYGDQLDFGYVDKQSNCPTVHNFLPFLELLCYKTYEVSNLVGEKVLPTYCFGRRYITKSTLPAHSDRNACEISLTVRLGGGEPWAFNVYDENIKIKETIDLEVGDAVLYLGCQIIHGRQSYKGTKHYNQVFLHYVMSRGPNSDYYFEKMKRVKIES